jgi:hypothetical protein
MSPTTTFLSATPVLASLDIERTVGFFELQLGFTRLHVEQGVYGVVRRGAVNIHFWACNDKSIAEATGCRVRVSGIQGLYEHCRSVKIFHQNAPLESKPWGTLEFAVLDPDGNLITFCEYADA